MKGFGGKKLACANSDTDKGKRTYEWKLPTGQQITVYFRREGDKDGMPGGHFHSGADPGKNPERILLLSGKMWMSAKDDTGNSKECVFDASDAPVEITIQPGIVHDKLVKEGGIVIEYRPTYFDPTKTDTYPPNELAD